MMIYVHMYSHTLNYIWFLVKNIINEYGRLSTEIKETHPLRWIYPVSNLLQLKYTKSSLTKEHHLWSTGWTDHWTRGVSISTGHYPKSSGSVRGSSYATLVMESVVYLSQSFNIFCTFIHLCGALALQLSFKIQWILGGAAFWYITFEYLIWLIHNFLWLYLHCALFSFQKNWSL